MTRYYAHSQPQNACNQTDYETVLAKLHPTMCVTKSCLLTHTHDTTNYFTGRCTPSDAT